MAFSTQREDSDGTLVLLDISIEYFDRSEIAVFLDGVLSTAWSWVGSTEKKISFSPAVPNGVEVMVVRSTDLSELRHMFSAGAAFTTQSLDEALLQILHIAQEARENATIEEVFHNLNMHGYRVVNVGPGLADTDAATMLQMNAAVSEAEGFADAAAASAASVNPTNFATASQGDKADSALQPEDIGDSVQAKLVTATQAEMETGTEAALRAMSPLRVAQAIAAQASSGLPTQTGNAGKVLKTDGTSVSWDSVITVGSTVATTSGTAFDFPGIPSTAKRVTLMLAGVSSSTGLGSIRAQLGHSGGVVTTGYKCTSSYISNSPATNTSAPTDGFDSYGDAGNTVLDRTGSFVFDKLSGNYWVCRAMLACLGSSPIFSQVIVGGVDVGAALTTVRLTFSSTTTFDAGSASISWE